MVAYITSLQSTGGMKSWGKVAMISCEPVEYCVGDDGRSIDVDGRESVVVQYGEVEGIY